ncbi:MAG: hypothetical protein U9N62_03130 [Thermotogota bacterium]|nr:hypothetical protein [Thermotogota bacterium]
MKTIKIDIDDHLLKKYRTEQLESFSKEQLRSLEEDDLLYEMMRASESSLEFWNNDIDDEAWNDL